MNQLMLKHEIELVETVFADNKKINFEFVLNAKSNFCKGNIVLYNQVLATFKLFKMIAFGLDVESALKFVANRLLNLSKTEREILNKILTNWYEKRLISVAMPHLVAEMKSGSVGLEDFLQNLSLREG